MKKYRPLLTLGGLLGLLVGLSVPSWGQNNTLPSFLKEKQVWNEKLVVVYAPEDQQQLLKEQLNAWLPYTQLFHQEKIVIVSLPTRLDAASQEYLHRKLSYQPDRFHVWVIDEEGNLRLSSTKLTQVPQLLRLLDASERPPVHSRAQLF
ncbi:hypothetical protein GCM10027275_11630 [Rhabdobacter roseus]|uniref:DUF4174 domain-containing protein n=1 Tax=Rhabdobacter roseus TaxID=1655419 RepID=A0A840TJG9_9BACT|nr:DUF4174 domain-containing protein [Rhabdobacter roseus]MBB5283075.1 hypothetical protein [Rhabdobacter roseus]